MAALPAPQYIISYLVGPLLIGVFFASLVVPQSVAAATLFPQPSGPVHPFLRIFASRELAMGIALTTLQAYEEWRAVTVLLGCVGLVGIHDFLLAGIFGPGWWKSFQAHGIPTIVGYWAVWKLSQEHFAA